MSVNVAAASAACRMHGLVCVLAPCTVAQASARTDRLEAGIVRAMNDFRAQHGLPKLRTQRGFARAADVHSAKMLRENRLAHDQYGKRVRRYVRRVARVGENLAWMKRCNPAAIVADVGEVLRAPPRDALALVPPRRRRPARVVERLLRHGRFRHRRATEGSGPLGTHTRDTLLPHMRRAFEHPLAPALGCALACLAYLIAQPATADMAAHSLPRVAVRAPRADGLERPVVRRASRARLLPAVRAAARWSSGPRSSASSPRSSPPRCSRRSRRPPRRRARRARSPPGCSPPACCPTWRSGGCRSCSGSRSASRPGPSARSGRRAIGGVLGLCTMLASPVAGVFLMLGAVREADRRRAARAAHRRRGSSCRR